MTVALQFDSNDLARRREGGKRPAKQLSIVPMAP
jgi:hypothetical protein